MIGIVRRVFSEGYRVCFLAAGLFAVFSGGVWGLWLTLQVSDVSWITLGPSIPPQSWHGHEMIFGYASAAIAGFLLTAVPNWTGARPVGTAFIAAAFLLWLAGRIAIWSAGVLPALAVAVADLAFVPFLAFQVARWLIRRPKPANVLFLGFLALFWLGNLLVHADWAGIAPGAAQQGLRTGLATLCAMISVLGGRVTPAFTRNAMMRDGATDARLPVSHPPLEKTALFLAVALPVVVLSGLPVLLQSAAALSLGMVQILRLAGWRPGWALRQPILIALHLGLAMLAAGLIAWGLAGYGLGSEVAALHLLGIGAVGGMTLAVMSRAALGHSGRALVAPRPVAAGYALLALAAVLRWVGAQPAAAGLSGLAMLAAAGLWTAVFAAFTVSLWPALTGPRLTSGQA